MRGWFGDEKQHPSAMRKRFYDRRLYPLPNYRYQDDFLAKTVPAEERVALEAEAMDRSYWTSRARQVLHGPEWRGDMVTADELEILLERNFLSGKQ
jgi:hypothetical protein